MHTVCCYKSRDICPSIVIPVPDNPKKGVQLRAITEPTGLAVEAGTELNSLKRENYLLKYSQNKFTYERYFHATTLQSSGNK